MGFKKCENRGGGRADDHCERDDDEDKGKDVIVVTTPRIGGGGFDDEVGLPDISGPFDSGAEFGTRRAAEEAQLRKRR